VNDKIRLGISTCLLGEKVRYNAGHKLDPYLSGTWGRCVEFVTVCPEVEAGFGVPREPMRLEGNPRSPRLVTLKSKTDLTDRMLAWAAKRIQQIEKENLCGFIFKQNSPSCGMVHVTVYPEKKKPLKMGAGLFAREFMIRFPLVPVEEESRLHHPAVRENFIDHIFIMKRWRELIQNRKTRGSLIDFHSRNKLSLLSHSPANAARMDTLANAGNRLSETKRFSRYQALLTDTLALKSTLRKHLNVLQHVKGYFKKQLTEDEKRELIDVFNQYRNGRIPLIVPMTLVNHYARKYDHPYLQSQTYLHPHPVELKLRISV